MGSLKATSLLRLLPDYHEFLVFHILKTQVSYVSIESNGSVSSSIIIPSLCFSNQIKGILWAVSFYRVHFPRQKRFPLQGSSPFLPEQLSPSRFLAALLTATLFKTLSFIDFFSLSFFSECPLQCPILMPLCFGLAWTNARCPPKRLYHSPSSAGQGRGNTMKGSRVKTRTGRGHSPFTVTGKTD